MVGASWGGVDSPWSFRYPPKFHIDLEKPAGISAKVDLLT